MVCGERMQEDDRRTASADFVRDFGVVAAHAMHGGIRTHWTNPTPATSARQQLWLLKKSPSRKTEVPQALKRGHIMNNSGTSGTRALIELVARVELVPLLNAARIAYFNSHDCVVDSERKKARGPPGTACLDQLP